MSKPSIVAREAAQVAPKYINEITHHQPTQITAVAPAEEGGWIVEAEVVEVRRVRRHRTSSRCMKSSWMAAEHCWGIGELVATCAARRSGRMSRRP
jgi:hypothetical protein